MTLFEDQNFTDNFNFRCNLSSFQAENTSRTKIWILEIITQTFRDENKLESSPFKGENNAQITFEQL